MNIEIGAFSSHVFQNGIFLSLFLSMLSFWIIFQNNVFARSAKIPKGASRQTSGGMVTSLPKPTSVLNTFSEKIFFLSFLFITCELIYRWFVSGHPPLSNLYESLLFLNWGLIGFFVFVYQKFVFFVPLELTSISREALDNSAGESRHFLGCILSSTALFIQTFADWRLPTEMRDIKPLIPALQSNWLLMHVSIMILSYAALLIGSIIAITYTIIALRPLQSKKVVGVNSLAQSAQSAQSAIWPTKLENPTKSKRSLEVDSKTRENISVVSSTGEMPTKGEFSFGSVLGQDVVSIDLATKSRFPLALRENTIFLDELDSLSYRILAFGFPLLTLGILSGAVWANEAWGSYWSWDPKETWAFITWLIYAFYLHTRLQYGWEGQKSAFVASFGFFIVWICYLGVNLLGKGLHSYGWLS